MTAAAAQAGWVVAAAGIAAAALFWERVWRWGWVDKGGSAGGWLKDFGSDLDIGVD
jgi:hypothetical protein